MNEEEQQKNGAEFSAELQKLTSLVSSLPPLLSAPITEQLSKTISAMVKYQLLLFSTISTNTEEALFHLKFLAFDLEATKREKAELEARLANE